MHILGPWCTEPNYIWQDMKVFVVNLGFQQPEVFIGFPGLTSMIIAKWEKKIHALKSQDVWWLRYNDFSCEQVAFHQSQRTCQTPCSAAWYDMHHHVYYMFEAQLVFRTLCLYPDGTYCLQWFMQDQAWTDVEGDPGAQFVSGKLGNMACWGGLPPLLHVANTSLWTELSQTKMLNEVNWIYL